jgi:hypothetical protein
MAANSKKEIPINFVGSGDEKDIAYIDGIELVYPTNFNYTFMRVNHTDPANDMRMYSDKIENITYGWIRTNSYLSLNINYVRCAYIKIDSTYSAQVAIQEWSDYHFKQRVFFIDTTTTCGRMRGSSSDCSKDTTETDKKLKNQAINYALGLPLNSAEEHMSVRATELKQYEMNKKRSDQEEKERIRLQVEKLAQNNSAKKAKIAEAKQRLAPCIKELKSIGFTVEEPYTRNSYQRRYWGGRRTRSRAKASRRKSRRSTRK